MWRVQMRVLVAMLHRNQIAVKLNAISDVGA